jgi:tetratricopeptide (TPR) repeat protein
MTHELDEKIHSKITRLSEEGDQFVANNEFLDAVDKYRTALSLIPQPIEKWDASTWLLVSLGEALFFQGDFLNASSELEMAMHCPDAIGNPLIHLRLGQVHLELGNVERARDELARAYMGGDMEIFEDEDPKYIELIRDLIDQH